MASNSNARTLSDFLEFIEKDMLLGMGYLGLFDAWELDRTGKQLHTVAH